MALQFYQEEQEFDPFGPQPHKSVLQVYVAFWQEHEKVQKLEGRPLEWKPRNKPKVNRGHHLEDPWSFKRETKHHKL